MATLKKANQANKPSGGKSETLKIRVEAGQRELIDLAAQALGKTRSAFMLEVAQKAAKETLLDQVFFSANDEQWAAFNEALERPTQKNEKLAKMLRAKTPWE